MKILFTIRSLTGGGAERVVSVLSGLLADVGEDVHIITYKTSERDYSISEKVQIHEMTFFHDPDGLPLELHE